MGRRLENLIGVLNGFVGDALARTGNGLATEMTLVTFDGVPLTTLEKATPRAVVFLHGLMNTEDCWRFEDGSDYGAMLARDFGYTPLYVRYNSGLPIPDNGAALCDLLDGLVARWPRPLEDILFVGYSMGGLIVRSACHVAMTRGEPTWLPKVKRAIYCGTPHRGAPMERAARVLIRALRAIPDPYTRLVADLGELRSSGIRDLGEAVLRDEDRATPVALRDGRHPVPLLPSISHFLIVASVSANPVLATLVGDAVNPVGTASDGLVVDAATLALPPDHVQVLTGLNHFALSRDAAVYACIRDFCRKEVA